MMAGEGVGVIPYLNGSKTLQSLIRNFVIIEQSYPHLYGVSPRGFEELGNMANFNKGTWNTFLLGITWKKTNKIKIKHVKGNHLVILSLYPCRQLLF